ncbi:SDR family oxidoreductase [Dactylosporangium sucinum]|uniref:Nucleotide-diphosphate-sugar epimerase n=1 Tax=Dactylosporangium sucinum TaxID=1424081 RepID=A0A917UDR3_9ACTN|nr:NAD(P)H-binding protein [Dactylosporangium sucinum]GGM83001.1 nucleotide-diphosphate-sugar epimerase [Dactylosporangium sucinum]
MTTVVTGATGGVGRHVVDRLVAAGERVRAVTRRPDSAAFPDAVTVVAGDLAEPATLDGVFDGADRLYLFPVAATAEDVVARARAAGVHRIVVLSSGAVTAGLDPSFHLPVEQAVERSGAEWTHVRPGEFMLNRVWLWGPSIRAERTVREPFPDVAWCPVHEQDIADVAAAALLEDGHAGRAYDLNGPALVSRRDQVRAIAEAIGEDVRLEVVTPQRARELYRAQGGFAAANADFLLGFEDYAGNDTSPDAIEHLDLGALQLPTAEAVNGCPARTFAQWARDHAADFS